MRGDSGSHGARSENCYTPNRSCCLHQFESVAEVARAESAKNEALSHALPSRDRKGAVFRLRRRALALVWQRASADVQSPIDERAEHMALFVIEEFSHYVANRFLAVAARYQTFATFS
jgi:hypothetical protein